MGIKGYITPDHQYYEAEERADSLDREVPIRPNAKLVWNGAKWDNERRKLFVQALEDLERDEKDEKDEREKEEEKKGVRKARNFSVSRLHFGLKDLITIGYFVVSLFGLWQHMSERILILEQKLLSTEKEVASLQLEADETNKALSLQVKSMEAQISELSMLVLRR